VINRDHSQIAGKIHTSVVTGSPFVPFHYTIVLAGWLVRQI
jgi:hypothetical protein